MITKERALEIAKKEVPDILNRYCRISLTKPKATIFGGVPDNCWYVTYSENNRIDDPTTVIIGSSMGIFIDTENGKIIFHDCLCDEG